MKKIIISLITVCLLINLSHSQTYSLSSLEGRDVSINFHYLSGYGTLKISYQLDTLAINYFMGNLEVKVLNKQFLLINYMKRAGTNEDSEYLLLLCVHDGKLYQAFHVNSLTLFDNRNLNHFKGEPNEYSLFKLKITLIGTDIYTYKLGIKVHDESISDQNPKANFNRREMIYLNFDKNRFVFFNTSEMMKGHFTIYNGVKDSIGKKIYIRNNIPVIKIEKLKYYYFEGNWYDKDKNDFFSIFL